jgi:hypothetical protein
MSYDIWYKIDNDINLKKFLRENSYWYKQLNRDSSNFNYFVNEMKVRYKLTTEDRINKMIDNMGMIQSFLDILK